MAAALLVLLIIFHILGFFSLFFGLPGTWIILASSALYAWTTEFEKISLQLLAGLFILAIAAEIAEHLLGMAGARRFGASKKGALISILGGVAGAVLFAPFLFGAGALVGLFAGAFFGAFVYELIRQRNLSRSLKSGIGAFLGRVSGTMIKLFIALGMIAAVLYRIF